MNTKILVAAHKYSDMPKDRSLYFPVLVVSAINYTDKNIDGFQRDDAGDNISLLNYKYNELTAVYWAWKNMLDVDAIGLVHYRRYFSKKSSRSLNSVLSHEDVDHLLSNYDIVLPKKRRYYIETNLSHYIHAHKREPMDTTREVIKTNFPDYLDSFDKVLKKRSAHMFNMFIMKKSLFDRYASWLFSILEQVDNKIDTTTYSDQEIRALGYISEILMDTWLIKNKFNYTEVNWIQIGNRNLIRKAFYFVKRKFIPNISGNSTHF